MRSFMDHAAGGEPDFEVLSAFADDRLSDSDRARAIEHMASCGRCRTIVAELTRSRSNARPAVSRRAGALPLAASLAIAMVGGTVYWVLRDTGANPVAPVVQPSRPEPATAPPSRSAIPGSISPSPAPSTPARPPNRAEPSDRTRATGAKSVGGRTFRLVAGEWIDDDYRLTDLLPVVDVQSRDNLTAHPTLDPFTALGRRFTVVVDRTVYRVAIPPE